MAWCLTPAAELALSEVCQVQLGGQNIDGSSRSCRQTWNREMRQASMVRIHQICTLLLSSRTWCIQLKLRGDDELGSHLLWAAAVMLRMSSRRPVR